MSRPGTDAADLRSVGQYDPGHPAADRQRGGGQRRPRDLLLRCPRTQRSRVIIVWTSAAGSGESPVSRSGRRRPSASPPFPPRAAALWISRHGGTLAARVQLGGEGGGVLREVGGGFAAPNLSNLPPPPPAMGGVGGGRGHAGGGGGGGGA